MPSSRLSLGQAVLEPCLKHVRKRASLYPIIMAELGFGYFQLGTLTTGMAAPTSFSATACCATGCTGATLALCSGLWLGGGRG
jgi:hypothetical protein